MPAAPVPAPAAFPPITAFERDGVRAVLAFQKPPGAPAQTEVTAMYTNAGAAPVTGFTLQVRCHADVHGQGAVTRVTGDVLFVSGGQCWWHPQMDVGAILQALHPPPHYGAGGFKGCTCTSNSSGKIGHHAQLTGLSGPACKPSIVPCSRRTRFSTEGLHWTFLRHGQSPLLWMSA